MDTVKVSMAKRRRTLWAWGFVLPQILYFIIASLYPIIMSYVYSVFEWQGIGPLTKFIGFASYAKLLGSPEFYHAFKNTLIYAVGFTVVSVAVSFVLALILNDPLMKGKGLYRTIYFLPVVTTTAVVGIVMNNIFGSHGLANGFLSAIGVTTGPVPWLLNAGLSMTILILVGAWKHIGITMIYWLTGLQTIPRDVYEAAQIDGAGYWEQLRYITLPLLKGIGAVILFLTVVSSMHVFDLVATLTGGGPFHATETLELFIYRYAFNPDTGVARVGYASAAGVLLGVFVLVVSLVLGWFVSLSGEDKEKRRSMKGVGER